MNVHNFDTQLDQNLVNIINNSDVKDIDEYKETIVQIRSKISLPANQGLDLMIFRPHDNIDTINNMDATKILKLILDIYKTNEENKQTVINLLDEQLSDMFLTGQCSQGRTIRLFQVYKSII